MHNIVLNTSDSLDQTIDCIGSILQHTIGQSYQLFILYLKNEPYVCNYLQNLADTHNQITIINSIENLKSSTDLYNTNYFLILSDQVLVPKKWLERLVQCVNIDANIAAASPLSSKMIPLPPGSNYQSIDLFIDNHWSPKYPSKAVSDKTCIIFKTSELKDYNLLDFFSAPENTLSQFQEYVIESQLRTVLADNIYLHCVNIKPSSYHVIGTEREYSKSILPQFFSGKLPTEVKPLTKMIMPDTRWSPLGHMRETYRTARKYYREHKKVRSLLSLFKSSLSLPFSQVPSITKCFLDASTSNKQLNVTYVLHNVTVAGGVISVIQLVNELILMGVNARIVALYQYPETELWKCYTKPIIFKDKNDMLDNFPNSDIIVATHWTTASWVSDIVNKYPNSRSAYFLQDYESWFFPESDPKSRQAVIDTYGLIDNKIVKSEWLEKLVVKDGYCSKKIHLGLDLGVFYSHHSNRKKKNYNRLTIFAMARPRTPRRGFTTLNRALELIKVSHPNTEIILFGDDLSNYKINYEFENIGIVTSASEMASLHSRADIFIDSSDFQGFGRTALEAMACDCCCILTEVGGVTEYAKNNVNCLLVPPNDPKSIFSAFQSILQSEPLSERIRRGAITTANDFSHKREAINTLSYFETILTK